MIPLLSADRNTLLSAGRLALQTYVKTGRAPELALRSAGACQAAGVFATITLRGQVRGQAGVLEHPGPLYAAVMEQVIAACEDPRSYPVGAEDLHLVRIELAVVRDLAPLLSLNDIVPGITGLAVAGNPPLALLPEAATNQGWGPAEFLAHVREMGEAAMGVSDVELPVLCFSLDRFAEPD